MPSTQQLKGQKNFLETNLDGLVFAFFIITRLLAIFFSLPCITDIGYYLEISQDISSQLVPYKNFSFEYPPLAVLPIYFPSLILDTHSFETYYLSFAMLMFLCDFLCLKLCQNYCRNQLAFSKREIAYMTLLYSFFGLLMFRIIYHRLDLLVALFFMTSLLFFKSKNQKLSASFFANSFLGFFYKIIPILNAPLAIIFKSNLSSKGSKEFIFKVAIYSSLFAVTIIATTFLLDHLTDNNFIKNMLFHQERGIQIESSFAALLIVKSFLLNQPLEVIFSYGSVGLKGEIFIEKIAKFLGFFLLLLFYASVFFIFLEKKIRNKKFNISEEIFLESTLISILLFVAFQRVLSTQFFIWLIPILAIFLAKNRSPKLLVIFSFLFLLTFLIFSYYPSLFNQEPILLTMICVRNIVLMILTCCLTSNFLSKLRHKNDRK